MKGARNELVAWFPWVDAKGAKRCLSDAVGIFLVGGRQKVQPLFPPTILTSAMAETTRLPMASSMTVARMRSMSSPPRIRPTKRVENMHACGRASQLTGESARRAEPTR